MAIAKNEGLLHRIKDLLKKVNLDLEIKIQEKRLGVVEWVNIHKKYGLINSENDEFLFFINSFREYIDDNTFLKLEGKEVSFRLKKSKKYKDRDIAIDIELE